MQRTTLILILGLTSLTSMGCAKRMDVLIRHPLQVGVVDQPNTIERRNGWQATLLTLDTESVCFDVVFSKRQPHQPPDVNLQTQALLMKSDGQWFRDAQITEMRQPQVSSYQGTVAQQYRAGSVTECVNRAQNGQCNRWEERPRYETRYVPATYYEAQGGGVVCFPNQGRVTTASDRVSFSINRINFRWGLESIIQEATSGGEQPQQPQQSQQPQQGS
ncbi:MAG: hypothetical protein AAGE52_28045 [Myxococcota bacterium]